MGKFRLGTVVGAAALMVATGCETSPPVLGDGAQEVAGETVLKGRDPSWILLPYPATTIDGDPLPIGDVVVFNQDVDGNPTPDTICSLLVDPVPFENRESPVQASGTSQTSMGGYLSLLQGLFPKAGASASAGVASKNIKSFTVDWGPRTKRVINYAPETGELKHDFVDACANLVKRSRENELAQYDDMFVVVGTLTADNLTLTYDLNPEAFDDKGKGEKKDNKDDAPSPEAALTAPARVFAASADESAAMEAKGEPVMGATTEAARVDPTIPETPCGTSANFDFNLASKVGVGGSADVCRSGDYSLKFKTPYTVALQLIAIDPFKLIVGATDDELAPIEDYLQGELITQLIFDKKVFPKYCYEGKKRVFPCPVMPKETMNRQAPIANGAQ